MINILHNLDRELDHIDIPPEIWSEWKESKITQHFYQMLKERQIDAIDQLIEPDSCVRSIRAKIELLETIINYKPESADV